jgi:hypothetical protein
MARKFSELREKMSPAARAASEREFWHMVHEMPPRKLRATRVKINQFESLTERAKPK